MQVFARTKQTEKKKKEPKTFVIEVENMKHIVIEGKLFATAFQQIKCHTPGHTPTFFTTFQPQNEHNRIGCDPFAVHFDMTTNVFALHMWCCCFTKI